MSRNPESLAGAPGRRADMAPVPRNPSAGHRINDLNRDLLLRLLSHLDARQAVQTCVLSLKWRDLWRDAPRLHASYHEFDIPGGDYDARNRLFKKFVNRLLMLRNRVRLEEFHLTYNLGPDPALPGDSPEASLWIRHALLCNARSVEVIVWDDRLDLDHAAGLTSESLTSLRFEKVALTRGFFRQLQRGCQALECLILQDCPINDTEISSQTLKFLSIGRECWFESHVQASISAPSLSHFGLFGHTYDSRIPLLKNMESLNTAYISFDEFRAVIQVDDICQFLKGLSSVTTLDFYYAASELEMAENLQWCPTFHNLKFLTLGRWCLSADYYALIVFLQNSPNLVKLTLQLEEYGRGFTGQLGKRSFTCKHLNIVEIICVERDEVVNSLEEFLLASGITPRQIRIKQ